MKNWFKKLSSKKNQLPKNIDLHSLQINGFNLPGAMIKRLETHKWKAPENKVHLKNLVQDHCPSNIQLDDFFQLIPDFYPWPVDLMKSESERLIKWLDPTWDKDRIMFLGQKDEQVYPGDIEHDQVILFADFGLGSDTCFALDFRENLQRPIVILEYWGKNPRTDNRWIKVADSFEAFEAIIWKDE